MAKTVPANRPPAPQSVRIEHTPGGYLVHHEGPGGGQGPASHGPHAFTDHSEMIAHVAQATAPTGPPTSMRESMQRALTSQPKTGTPDAPGSGDHEHEEY